MTYLERLFAALYISEAWYSLFASTVDCRPCDKIYGRTRSVVVFDRVMAGEYDPKKIDKDQ